MMTSPFSFITSLALLVTFFCLPLSAHISRYFLGPHYINVGVEGYRLTRLRDGGSHQMGYLYGWHGRYERVRHCSLYWGADLQWAQGPLRGKTGRGAALRSTLTDFEGEARLGYTFGPCLPLRPCCTLAVGYGYFIERNAFLAPSPLIETARTSLTYISGMILVSCYPLPRLMIGGRAWIKVPLTGQCRISDDPEIPSVSIPFVFNPLYTLEIPIFYRTCWNQLDIGIVPFYRFRHYGGCEASPFNFYDTVYRIYGIRLAIQVTF